MKYARERAKAIEIIKRKGQPVVIRVAPTIGTTWAETGSSEPVDHPTDAAFFPNTRTNYETARLKGFELKGSVYALIPYLAVIPKPGDRVVRNGVELNIEMVNSLSVNGEVLLHEVYLNGDINKSQGDPDV
jgi:hypothetical protein